MKKKDVFYYTKRNITLISTTIVFVCLFIFAMITQFLYTSRVFKDIDKEILHHKDMIEHKISISIDNKEVLFKENMHFQIPPIPPNIICIIYFKNQVQFISPNAYFDADSLPDSKKLVGNKISELEYNGHRFRGIGFQNKEYNVQLLSNIDLQVQSIKQLNNSIILSLIVLIAIALALAAFLAKKVIKPVREAYDKQVFFVQDSSHEMKTPLAVIKGKLELLANSWGETIDDNFEHISKMMSEVRSLEKLNSDLLLLTKEDINSNVNTVKVNLKNFILDISDFYIDLAEIQNKEFQVINPKTNVELQWDYNKIKRVVVILLENAFKYTPDGGKITLTFEEFNKYIKITVKDTGIGIKKQDQERIFDRFFRSSDVRGSNINGSGIGLSLLKSITNSLEIQVKFSSKFGVGTEFELNVPKIIK